MAVIHIREQGATVRRRGERLVISKHREVIDQFPFAKVEELALYGNVQVTAQAMATLLEQGVRVERQGEGAHRNLFFTLSFFAPPCFANRAA